MNKPNKSPRVSKSPQYSLRWGSLGVGCGSGSAMGWNVQVDQKISLQAGSNSIALLSMTVGLQVCSCLLLITDTLPV
jgi:hypothetical protein